MSNTNKPHSILLSDLSIDMSEAGEMAIKLAEQAIHEVTETLNEKHEKELSAAYQKGFHDNQEQVKGLIADLEEAVEQLNIWKKKNPFIKPRYQKPNEYQLQLKKRDDFLSRIAAQKMAK